MNLARGDDSPTRPALGRLTAIGGVGGLMSGLLGIGGGVVMVPLLVFWGRQTQRRSAAVSLGAIIPISVISITAYALAHKVNLMAAIYLSIGAIVGARMGAELLTRLHERALKLTFGCFLVLAAALMVLKG